MFRGLSSITIDTKGRIAMPRRYRDSLLADSSTQWVLTIDTESRCLLLYLSPEWEQIEQKLLALPSFDPSTRRIQRLLIGHATDVEMDKQGRMLVSPVLRDYAGLDGPAMLVGQGNKFELWSEAQWVLNREAWLAADNQLTAAMLNSKQLAELAL